MLNKDGIRELAYAVIIDDIKPIEGKDRVECAIVNGWTVMVKKEHIIRFNNSFRIITSGIIKNFISTVRID